MSSWSRCRSSDLTTIPFGQHGARITVQRRAVPAFRALESVMNAHRYHIRPADTGAYNCRVIAGTSTWSNHAYGIAVDVNWQTNPYSSRLITDMPAAMIRDIENIRTADGTRVFRWGGRYSGSKDAMHFEVMVSPEQIARGITGQGGFTVAEVEAIVNAIQRQGELTRQKIEASTDKIITAVQNQGKLTREKIEAQN